MSEEDTPIIPEVTQHEEEPDKNKVVAAQFSMHHSGPLPAPDDFKAYGEALEGACDRILAMAEKEQYHKHQFDNKQLDAAINNAEIIRKLEKTGQVWGSIIALALSGAGVYLAQIGCSWIAGIVFSSVVLGICSAYIFTRQPKKSSPGDNQPEPDDK